MVFFVAISGGGGGPRAGTIDVDYFTVVAVLAPLPVAALWLFIATDCWHWAAPSPVVPGDPPYR
jgi:hypothetical protein